MLDSYESLSNEISRIQFHTDLDNKTKNKLIKQLEKKMEDIV